LTAAAGQPHDQEDEKRQPTKKQERQEAKERGKAHEQPPRAAMPARRPAWFAACLPAAPMLPRIRCVAYRIAFPTAPIVVTCHTAKSCKVAHDEGLGF
jgi:hypothetical protein